MRRFLAKTLTKHLKLETYKVFTRSVCAAVVKVFDLKKVTEKGKPLWGIMELFRGQDIVIITIHLSAKQETCVKLYSLYG